MFYYDCSCVKHREENYITFDHECFQMKNYYEIGCYIPLNTIKRKTCIFIDFDHRMLYIYVV